jgi:outer membrane biosynthesis protein TonB
MGVTLILASVLAGCGIAAQPTPTSTPVPTPPPTTAPSPTPVPTPPPTATPAPSPTPVPVTATPVPPLPLRISAQLDPPTPHAGEEFVVALSVTNDGTRPARGVYIATSGPWDRWTVLGVEPDGTFDRDAAGWHIVSGEEIPPAETRTTLVHVRADEPAQEQLTFAVREAEPGELSP